MVTLTSHLKPVDYKIIGEDGSTLKEGTLEDTSDISLDDVDSGTFRVIVSGHVVMETKGFETIEDNEPGKLPEGPQFDPSDSFDDDLHEAAEVEGESVSQSETETLEDLTRAPPEADSTEDIGTEAEEEQAAATEDTNTEGTVEEMAESDTEQALGEESGYEEEAEAYEEADQMSTTQEQGTPAEEDVEGSLEDEPEAFSESEPTQDEGLTDETGEMEDS